MAHGGGLGVFAGISDTVCVPCPSPSRGCSAPLCLPSDSRSLGSPHPAQGTGRALAAPPSCSLPPESSLGPLVMGRWAHPALPCSPQPRGELTAHPSSKELGLTWVGSPGLASEFLSPSPWGPGQTWPAARPWRPPSGPPTPCLLQVRAPKTLAVRLSPLPYYSAAPALLPGIFSLRSPLSSRSALPGSLPGPARTSLLSVAHSRAAGAPLGGWRQRRSSEPAF